MLNYFLIGAGAFQHSHKAAAPEFIGTAKGGEIMLCQNGFINEKYRVIGCCIFVICCCDFAGCSLWRFFLLKGSNDSLSRCHCLTFLYPCCIGWNQWEIDLVFAKARSLAVFWLCSIAGRLVRI